MSSADTGGRVLLLGATGRTGRRASMELLQRGVPVRALVRSAERLPAGVTADPRLTVADVDLASMSVDELREHLVGRDAAISCLGHAVSLRGVFGPPRDLVEAAVRKLVRAAEATRPAAPIRPILMSSVSVHRPPPADARRGASERAFPWALRGLVPPARDDQRAADVLATEVGADHPAVEGVVVRPDAGDRRRVAAHTVTWRPIVPMHPVIDEPLTLSAVPEVAAALDDEPLYRFIGGRSSRSLVEERSSRILRGPPPDAHG